MATVGAVSRPRSTLECVGRAQRRRRFRAQKAVSTLRSAALQNEAVVAPGKWGCLLVLLETFTKAAKLDS